MSRRGARWHLFCFSDGNVKGVVAPLRAVTDDNIRDTLTANGWRIDFLGPTTFLANTSSFAGDPTNLPERLRRELAPEQLERFANIARRFAVIKPLLDGDRLHLPFTVVHATRVG